MAKSSYNLPQAVAEAKERLNQISPSFCMAKWMHATIHLHMGRTHSCYLPPTHQIPIEEIQNNPQALHNTTHKKEQRRLMLEGKRPSECQICWDIEDLPEERFSERHYRGQDFWAKPFFDQVTSQGWEKDINPSYLEVSFSSQCNFRCSYCNPTFSSAWLKEVEANGAYILEDKYQYQSPHYLKEQNLMPLEEEHNPYLEAFEKWWPTLKEQLLYFRITGGEPLLSSMTFKILKEIDQSALPKLELALNTNLGVTDYQFSQFYGLIKSILHKKHVRHFMLNTSIDSYGHQAEYIRNGLNFQQFEKRVEQYLETIPSGSLTFICTYNALSVVGFRRLLDWVISLRKRYSNDQRNIFLDTPHLQGPEHQSCLILPESYLDIIENDIAYMKSREDILRGVKPSETMKMTRIYEWMKNKKIEEIELKKQRANFYHFFNEHDRRRQTHFLKQFPEMKEFYQLCKSEAKIP